MRLWQDLAKTIPAEKDGDIIMVMEPEGNSGRDMVASSPETAPRLRFLEDSGDSEPRVQP